MLFLLSCVKYICDIFQLGYWKPMDCDLPHFLDSDKIMVLRYDKWHALFFCQARRFPDYFVSDVHVVKLGLILAIVVIQFIRLNGLVCWN